MKKFSAVFVIGVGLFSSGLFAGEVQVLNQGEAQALQIYQMDLEIETDIEKLEGYTVPCVPALRTQKDIRDRVLSDRNVVEVLKFEYLNAEESLKDCPDRGVFKSRVRYLAK